MGLPRRRGAVRASNPEAIAARLPERFRTFRPSTDPADLREHLSIVCAMVGAERLWPVMSAAGLSVAGWFRQALAQEMPPTDHARHPTFVDDEGNERPLLRSVERPGLAGPPRGRSVSGSR
jgi:hypothetical protein